MVHTRKTHRRDRYDGYYLSNLDAMHIMMPYLMPHRTDNEAVLNETVDMTNVIKYIEEKNVAGPEHKYTVFHVIAAALAKTIYLRPKMNYFIAGGRMYERKNISFSFVAKNKMIDNADESLLIFRLDTEGGKPPIDQVHDFVCGEVYKIRRESKTDGTTDQLNILTKMPGFLLSWVMKLLTVMNDRGHLPKALRPVDPYSATVFMSNLGSIKLSANYHHLANWGTNSIFLVIGELKKTPYFSDDGSFELRDSLDLGFTIDERIADGMYFSNTIKLFRKIMANPRLLDAAVDSPIE